MPVRLAPKEFDAVVQRAFAALPVRFRGRLDNLAVVIEPRGVDPNVLGLFDGHPRTEMRSGDLQGGLPGNRIYIYQHPHEQMARDRRDLEHIVTDTVWHEVGHYFGLSEREIHAAEGRRRRLRPYRRMARLAPSGKTR